MTYKNGGSIFFSPIFIVVVVLLSFSSHVYAAGATYYIDPTAPTNGNGSLASPFNSWGTVSLLPGNTYLQKGGTVYTGTISLNNLAGSASMPTTIGSYGSGQAIVSGGFNIVNSSYLTVQNFTVQNTSYSQIGVSIQTGSNHITIQNNTIQNEVIGISFNNFAGANNIISNNTLINNQYFGITIYQVNCSPGNETLISGNNINNNGSHGIEITGNYYIVERNIVHDNGLTVSGSSGIHAYAGGFNGDPFINSGSYNIIRYNVVYKTHDNGGDGNGIQVDQHTHDNQVYNNLIYSNDGQGVSIYDSWNNQFTSNVLFNNGLDPGKTHGMWGNLEVDGTSANHWAYNNTFQANTVVISNVGAGGNPGPFGFDVGPIAGTITFASNNLLNIAPVGTKHLYRWALSEVGDDKNTWNAKPTHTAPDTVGSVPVSDIANTTLPMDFVIPTADALTFTQNAKTITLAGWRADTGLYGHFPISTDTTPPSTPTALSGTAISSSQINLTWSASTDNVGVTGYKIFRNSTQVGTSATASYSDTGLTASTVYSYTVSAYDAAGNNSAQSAGVSVTTLSSISVPVISSSATASATTGNAFTYSIVASNSPTSFNATVLPAGLTVNTATGVISGTPTTAGTYSVNLSATNSAGTGTKVLALTITAPADTTPPSTPTALSGTAISSSQINLTWSASTDNVGVTGYKIFRNSTQVGTSATNSYSDSGGLTPSTTYTYTVSAYDAAGNNSAQSAGVSVTTLPPTASFNVGDRIQTTAALNVRATPSTSATLLGTQVSGAWGTLAGGPIIANSYIWWNITYDIAPSGWSVQDYLIKVPPDTTPPSTPTALSGTAISSSQINLTWSASTDNVGVTGYKIFRNSTQVGTSATASYSDTGLTASTVYSYTVSAYDAAGNNSAQSANISVTALPATVTATTMRGAMSPTTFLASDFTAFGGYKGNLLRLQIMRNYGQADTERNLTDYDAWIESELNAIDLVLPVAQANGFKVVIDMHTPSGGRHADLSMAMFYEQVYNDDFIRIWKEIATRYKGNPAVWAYELVNEPTESATTPPVGLDSRSTEIKAAQAIRAIDPTTPIIVEPMSILQYGTSPDAYKGFTPITGISNIWYTVHAYSYSPGFVRPPYGNGTDCYPGPSINYNWNKTLLAQILSPARNFQTTYGVKMYASEFSIPVGACGATQFLSDYIDLFESYGWDWTYHAFREAPMWSMEASDRLPLLSSWFAKNVSPYPTTTDTTPPSTPTALSGTAISSSQINLTWSASTDNVGVTGYKIFRNSTQVGTSATASYSDTGLTASTVYSYTVSAYDAAGNTSAQTGGTKVITLGASAPSIAIGSRVVTTANLNVRSSASVSASKLGTESVGALGTVIGGPTVANGHTWWQINYDNAISGWSIVRYLVPVTAISSPAVGMAAPATLLAGRQPSSSLINHLLQQVQSLLQQIQVLQSQTAAAAASLRN